MSSVTAKWTIFLGFYGFNKTDLELQRKNQLLIVILKEEHCIQEKVSLNQ